ncbi:hypothetical protein [Sphingobacterium pedocola]|jgi:hypothetical protein|uniref:Uncharacterized protein n=1 Tax=Sphingobacterium pedocola TaxID=2082722 RepID=A0ABR9TD47_9SPHI|nr:hypothetical protein [Sphingobacterium pedocola]MBE8722989.1 hypothetical protein [Sphingobacterium pedocola]
MNFDSIQLGDLERDTSIPNTVEEQVEETWFVKYGEQIVGVGLFLPNNDRCVVAIIGEDYDNKIMLGTYGSGDDYKNVVYKGLNIAYEGYLRSIKGDTVIGEIIIDKE